MNLRLLLCGAICAVALADAAAAKSTILQTVDLSDKHMSTEGGEARLYLIEDSGRRHCRIEAIHFGEMGKAVDVFDFGRQLIAAESREYRYAVPIYVDLNVKETLANRVTLSSEEGRETLPAAFEEYRSFFDARLLARCSGKPGR